LELLQVFFNGIGPEPKKLEINGKSAVGRRPDMTAAGLDSRC
jgi:hypothetical protein